MSFEIQRKGLGSLVTYKKGFAFKSKDYTSTGTPVVRVSNFTWDSISTDDLRFINNEISSSNKVVSLKKYDVIIATVGSWPQNPASIVGKVVRVPSELSGSLLNQNTVRLRVLTDNIIDQRYLYIALKNNEFSEHIISKAQGSANQASITLSDIFSYAIPWGNSLQRKFIVDVIDSINDKIVINKNINQTLEQMAQALFKSWFVDFEPVKAKIAVLEAGGSQEEAILAAMTAISGKDADSLAVFEREHPEQYAELKAMAELFPSAMQDSELGEIPEGWNVCNIKSSVTELRRGISPKYTEETDGVIVINQKCIRNHTINFSLARLHDSKKRTISGRELQVGDVLVNSTGTGTLGRLAPIRYLAETVIADSHVTVVRADTAKITASYLSGLLMKYEQFIESNGSGSTGQTELRKEVLEEIYFPCPQLILGQLFDKFTSRLNEKFSLLEQQITVLSQLRDTLLPKLLSGEITLPEAETWAAQVDTQEA